MKLFVCEFITGGGLCTQPLPSSLANEGIAMRDALLHDLLDVAGVSITLSYDARLAEPNLATLGIANPCDVNGLMDQAIAITSGMDAWSVWETCIVESDAVWLIAPETDGVLAKLSNLVVRNNKILIGSAPEAIEIAASKWATNQLLQSANINTVPTYRFDTWNSCFSKDKGTSVTSPSWVAKQEDGAGCEDSGIFNNDQVLARWMATRKTSHIIQPYQAGHAASISMLCKSGKAWLLSCNQQKITVSETADAYPNADSNMQISQFSYHGSRINGMAKYWVEFELIAQQIAALLPGLAGYIGIDLIVEETESGDLANLYVLEINPRLTTSYVGLRQAIGHNPAKLILDLLLTNTDRNTTTRHENHHASFQMPTILRQQVDVSLHA